MVEILRVVEQLIRPFPNDMHFAGMNNMISICRATTREYVLREVSPENQGLLELYSHNDVIIRLIWTWEKPKLFLCWSRAGSSSPATGSVDSCGQSTKLSKKLLLDKHMLKKYLEKEII